MNEDSPAPLSPKIPEPAPRQIDPLAQRPNFWGMFWLGVLLVVVSCLICAPFHSPIPFGIGALAALVSLFFPGYRGIFIGFISTIGVVLLGAAVICGAMIARIH